MRSRQRTTRVSVMKFERLKLCTARCKFANRKLGGNHSFADGGEHCLKDITEFPPFQVFLQKTWG